ncbi:PaaX family transcriptional regulator C-terminal domain-containing protein [Roseibium aggregatum]|uniref:PaaX family transcriptional regulator n=1 Tax=Roseibium aggregatum TaxID=187304 RepID=UPI003A9855AB
MHTDTESLTEGFLQPFPPKAAQLIVTIYGDIVEPRGGVLWMGDLISLCASFGVNESLVRTAVSRLVSKGQLTGEREGRRSFYALTPDAREEYHLAADLFYGPEDTDCGWLLTHCTEAADQAILMRFGFASLEGNVFIGADRPGRPLLGTTFRATDVPNRGDLKNIASSAFGLGSLARDYAEFVSRFGPMQDLVARGLLPRSALLFRLALVHAYRGIRLRDPRLPRSVLPKDWSGYEARSLFAALYRNLSPGADGYIAQNLMNQDGLLAEEPDAVLKRMRALSSSI